MNHHEQIVSKLQEDLMLRGLALRTQQSYVWCVRTFLTYCNRPVCRTARSERCTPLLTAFNSGEKACDENGQSS